MIPDKKTRRIALLYCVFIVTVNLPILFQVDVKDEIIINKEDSIGNDIDKDITLKTSGFWSNFTYIHIKGNWTVANETTWCKGSGTWNDPYIIENVIINATDSPTGTGILIEESYNDYFIIRNCTIFNAGNAMYDAGIKLENTNNGTLVKNNSSNNGGDGILLNNECKNNTLSDNIANYNVDNGINLYWKCINNSILNNTISYNGLRGIDISLYCNYTTIIYNKVSNNSRYGILIASNCYYNTILNNTISDHQNFAGIYVVNTSNENEIINNTVYNCEKGISLSNSHQSNISNNILYDNNYGIYLTSSSNANIYGNKMTSCGIYIEGSLQQYSTLSITKNNTVNEKPVYYYYAKENLRFNNFSNAGQVILINCNNSIIENINVSYSSIAIYMYYCKTHGSLKSFQCLN